MERPSVPTRSHAYQIGAAQDKLERQGLVKPGTSLQMTFGCVDPNSKILGLCWRVTLMQVCVTGHHHPSWLTQWATQPIGNGVWQGHSPRHRRLMRPRLKKKFLRLSGRGTR